MAISLSYIDKVYLTNNVFQIGSFNVDAKRGVIFNDVKSTSIEPKVMLVLISLCQNPKQVIRQEELFQEVWPKSIFNPNSLRRCIAELRKAFDDHDKELITTHPKIGYSINSDVTFLDKKPKLFEQKGKFEMIIGGLVLAMVFLLYLFPQTEKNTSDGKLTFSAVEPLTATEEIEDFIAIAPNEDVLAFTRDISENQRAIWLKNVNNNKEHQLSFPYKNIRNLAWGETSKELYFVEVLKEGWIIWQTQLDANNQIDSEEQIVISRQSSWISSIRVDKDKIYYIEKKTDKFTLIELSLDNLSRKEILQSNANFTPYDLAINSEKQQLSVSGTNQQGLATVKIISIAGKNVGEEIKLFHLNTAHRFSIETLVHKNGYILNNGRELFQLNEQGALTKLDFEHYQFIRFVKPSKISNNLYLITSNLDTDFKIHMANNHSVNSIVNSNGMDYFPSISPNNSYLSFYSTRFGLPQLFVKDLKTNTEIRLFDNKEGHLNVEKSLWNPLTNQLAFSVGYNIYVMEVNSPENIGSFDIKGRVISWYPDGEHLLILQSHSNIKKLIKFNTQERTTKPLATYEAGRPFLGDSENVYLATDNELKRLNYEGRWVVSTRFESKVKRIISHQAKTFLRFDNKPNWYKWSAQNGLQKTPFSNQENAVIATISDDESLAISVSELRQNDILKLSYN